MSSLYVRSHSIERSYHPSATQKGFRHTADFTIKFEGIAYTTLVLTVLWNQKNVLVRGTTRTQTTVTEATTTLSKSGGGWGVVAEIPGDEGWIEFKNTIIRFRKSFTLEVPIAPALAKVPVIGEMAKDLGATKTSRVEVEGHFDVISYLGGLKATVR